MTLYCGQNEWVRVRLGLDIANAPRAAPAMMSITATAHPGRRVARVLACGLRHDSNLALAEERPELRDEALGILKQEAMAGIRIENQVGTADEAGKHPIV